jgi:hypothetical protein
METRQLGSIFSQRRFRLRLSIGLCTLLCAASAGAVGTRRFVLEQGSDFKGGDLTGVAIDSSGRVRAGLELGHIAIDNAPVIWSALARDDKSLLLGTGQEGKLLEYRGDRVVATYETGGLVVTSIVEAWGGSVIVASLPQGKLWRFEHGKLSLFVQLKDIEHVWQLGFDKKNAILYAATGPDGKLLRIERDGRASVIFDAPEPHLVSLAILPDAAVVVGSSEKAKLYRVDGPSRVTTLYDFGRTEVRAIAVSAQGDIYAIANDIKTTASIAASRTGTSDSGSTASTSTPSKAKGRGTLLRLSHNGVPELLLDDDNEHYTSLGLGKDGQPYVGTGVEGRLYTVNAQRQSVLVADIDARQITAQTLTGALPALISSDPAGVHPIEGQGGRQSVWTSKVFDAGLRASFGRIDWEATGQLEFMSRTGNTKEPDDTWSPWSAPLRSPGRLGSPAARFVQVRSRWGLDPKAVLTRVEIPFITDNQRAVVTRIDVGSERSSGDAMVASGGPVTGRSNPEVSLDWNVDNPDKDTLRYRIYYRLVGTNTWYDVLPLDEVLTKTSYKWDTSALPEGRYRIKVMASDEPSNPLERVTRHELESGVIIVDNTPPTLIDLELIGKRLRGRAVDGVGPIQRIEVSVAGTNEWIPLSPLDSIFDEATEGFDVSLSDWLPAGRRILAVRAYDSANNYVVRHVTLGL